MLLEQIGVSPVRIIPAEIDETPKKKERPPRYAMRMAVEKAAKVASENPEAYVLAADTVVACGHRILPKAETQAQGRECLELLSGRRHNVFGGICLIKPDGTFSTRLVKTAVTFRRLSDEDKEMYLESMEWEGKAGGYAIQGLASLFIKGIIGSYSNIVGLCLYETGNLLLGNSLLKKG